MKASEEIRSILDRCKSGELAHDQSLFFCGTARCIAGWKVHLDYVKKSKNPNPESDDLWLFLPKNAEYPSTYAARKWKLDHDQAWRLFGSEATFPEQYAVVEELEAQGK